MSNQVSKKGFVTVGGKRFFARSSYESNIAAYFQFLKEQGQIADWKHEPTTFWFEKIRRGVRSYLPDFLITNIDGSEYYAETKGFFDSKSKTKINRMRIYYPHIKLEIIDSARYKGIAKNASLYPEWGALDRIVVDPESICSLEGCNNVRNKKGKGYCNKHHTKIYGK